jgi:hypothetical protein
VARRILIRSEGSVELVERDADNEFELQQILRQAPNLIPVDDLGLDGPMMVIGRETALPSGRVDLLGVTPAGDILVIEFKTGPNNPDYRHALAQLLDYGSDLWRMAFEEFDTTVTVSYLQTKYCAASDPAHDAPSLREAAHRTWPELADDQLDSFEQRITARLADGGFHFVLVAQRITNNSRSTIEYLQQVHATGSFHAVELVKFSDVSGTTTAYEGRVVTSPARATRAYRSPGKADPDAVLAAVDDLGYREALEELLEYCRSLRLSFEAGSVGFSIRVNVPDRKEPVSLGWLFPPGTTGWLGLTGLTLGYDIGTVQKLSVAPQLATYAGRLRSMDGLENVGASGLDAVAVSSDRLLQHRTDIAAAIGDLVAAIGQAE